MSIKRVEAQSRGLLADRAHFARLSKDLPLKSALTIFATMLAERQDLDGNEMQVFQRKINDITWPLVTVDQNDRDKVRNSV